MTRNEMITIIKARSEYKIDRRRGNYELPVGRLSTYVKQLVDSQLEVDHLGIAQDGNMYFTENLKYDDTPGRIFSGVEDETTTLSEQELRIKMLVREIVG